MNYIYLDNNATTQIEEAVLKEMEKDLKGPPSNPSSNHFLGKKAKKKILQSKKTIASYLKIDHEEIIFTSGGTESLSFLINGAVKSIGKGHIITTDIEHACIYNTILELEKNGCEVSYIKTGLSGVASLNQITENIKTTTKLIVLSAVNSETGTITDLKKISELAIEKNICFIIDGVAILGKKIFDIPKNLTGIGFSSHKIHGPKGIGFVYISKDFPIKPMLLGGAQENNLRAGTENLTGIVATSKAVEIAYENLDANINYIQDLKDYLESSLSKYFNIEINGKSKRICNTSNISFTGFDAEDILMQLDLSKIVASHGSACQSNTTTLSRVLLNMGLNRKQASSSIRFSLSKFNTKEEIDIVINTLIKILNKLRA